MGLGSRETARLLRRQYGLGLVRALRISRTETMRAYREAARRNYQANSDVVRGWYWHATLDTRTCPSCWAMHGTFHQLDETLDDHPNGRCAMRPATVSWAKLGYPNIPDAPAPPMGVDVFADLPPASQAAILGKAAFAAWRDGALELKDFVGRKRSRTWGTMRYTRSLSAILGAEAEQYRVR
jgi:SPP1 gp7 family putative phage head morphogenesis protein